MTANFLMVRLVRVEKAISKGDGWARLEFSPIDGSPWGLTYVKVSDAQFEKLEATRHSGKKVRLHRPSLDMAWDVA